MKFPFRIASVLLAASCLLSLIAPVHAQTPPPPAEQTGLFARASSQVESAAVDIEIAKEWEFIPYGTSLGLAGLQVGDINHDGEPEIIVTESGPGGVYWRVLQATAANSYATLWTSGAYPGGMSKLVAADVNGDSVSEIFVASSNSVLVYRGSDFAQTGSFTPAFTPTKMIVADADGNGSQEILLSDDTKIAAYSTANYALLWQTAQYGGDLAVANVDADATPEIVSAGSTAGYVLNGATRAVEWQYTGSGGFGTFVRAGDVDGDGMAEIVGAQSWYKITIFDADLKSPMWEITPDLDIQALALANVDDDSRLEILYGDGQWGEIHAYDGVNHTEQWKIGNPEHGVTNLAVGDANGDGIIEVLWGAGWTSSGSDYLYVADTSTRQIEWHSFDWDGPYAAVDTGDIDEDGQVEILMASTESESGYGDGVVAAFDGETHQIEWQITDIPNILTWSGIDSLRIGDVDGDGDTEFVLATSHTYEGLIQIYDGKTHTLERSSQYYDSASMTAMELGDVDGDGQVEIVAAQKSETTDATGVSVLVINGATGTEEWKSISLSGTFGELYDVKLEDIDGDGHVEILVSVKGGKVYVFDGVTHVMDTLIDTNAYSVTTLIEPDFNYLVVGASDGYLDFYNGKTFEYLYSAQISTAPVTCLSITDIDLNGQPEILACTANKLAVYSYEGALQFTSDDLSGLLGSYNQISVVNVDGDRFMEILVGSYLGLFQFQSGAVGPLDASAMSVYPGQVEPGGELIYTLTLRNSGDDPLPDVQVSNPLPAEVDYVPGSLITPSGTADYAGGVVTWSGSLGAGEVTSLNYHVTVKPDTPRLTVLTNTALIQGGEYSREVSATAQVKGLGVYMPVIFGKNPCESYFDDFSKPSSGWAVGEDSYLRAEYLNGEYRMLAKSVDYYYYAKAPTCRQQNYTVEVDARWAGNTGEGYGLIFGLSGDLNSYYMFWVNSDFQDFALGVRTASSFRTIQNYKSSSAIHSGASNHIKITRNGNQIQAWINGTLVGTWYDSTLTGLTYMGLVTLPYTDLSNADARFDNFRVTVLPGLPGTLSEPVEAAGQACEAGQGLFHQELDANLLRRQNQ